MIVYGDRTRRIDPFCELTSVAARFCKAQTMTAGLARHHELVSALILLGQVAQGLADLDRERFGHDGASPGEARLAPALMQVARAVVKSWASGFADLAQLPEIEPLPELPRELAVRVPEGYAFYAVYPEAYAEAAGRLRLLAPARVIGIRSIGTSLGAVAAAALSAPSPLTVRPVGPPFARRIDVDLDVAQAWTSGDFHYVIVDEGPGLSGSSFAAVVAWLEDRGVPRSHMALLPSHTGEPGAEAGPETRAMWKDIQRQVVTAGELIPPRLLARWARHLFDRTETSMVDISGGGWRQFRYRDEGDWPAVAPHMERPKWLLDADGTRWLLKFAGLGEEGERKMARARMLAEAGLVPPLRGMLHGWAVERWVETVPHRIDDPELANAIVHYMVQRARRLPPPDESGADLATLFAMARYNIEQALGAGLAERFVRLHAGFADLQHFVRPVAVDGRMDLHEWLKMPEGGWLKADALDHDGAHDLIGPQDMAWDVAGAIVELDLEPAAAETLRKATEEAAGFPVHNGLLQFLLPCYAAFRIGLACMSASALGGWPAEAARNRDLAQRYAAKLYALLESSATSC